MAPGSVVTVIWEEIDRATVTGTHHNSTHSRRSGKSVGKDCSAVTNSLIPRLRRGVGVLAAAAVMAGGAAMAVPSSATADADRLTTWTSLNVRSSPSASSSIVGGLYPGQLVTADGAARNGWTPVIYNGKRAWVSSQYVRVSGSGKASSPSGTSAASSSKAGSMSTTAAVNLRSGPSTSTKVVTVLANGTRVSTTGTYRNGFAEVRWGGATRWISTQYLKPATSSSGGGGNSSSLPKVTGTRVATTALMVRTTSDSSFKNLGDVPKGTVLSITGVTRNGVAQIVYRGAVRWVNAQYLAKPASGPSTPATPKVTGYRYATTALMIRTTSDASFKNLGDVPKGTRLAITGVTRNGVAQVVHNKAVRWVNARYLSATPPATGSRPPAGDSSGVSGSGLSGLRPSTKALLNQVHQRYPQISWYNGVRPDAIPDHPSGRALDVMLSSNYRNADQQRLGREIAEWAKTNARSLGVEYIIFDQKIWNVKRASEGWRYMADRGSDNANHKNHVHITMLS